MFGLGLPELVVVLLLALLIFGGTKLPEVARGLGKAIRGFKEEAEGMKREIEKAAEVPSAENKETKPESKERPAPSTK